MRWLIYGLGGGLGHAVRCASLAGALEELGVHSRVLCSDASAPVARSLFHDVVGLGREEHPNREALRRRVEQELHGRDLLLLDTFPRGILSELEVEGRGAPRFLLTRLVAAPDARLYGEAGWAELGLRGVVDIEPNLGWLPGPALRCGPVARRLARPHLTPEPDVEIALKSAAARERTLRLLRRLPEVRWRTLVAPQLVEGFTARILVGAAGYNLSYELAGAGIWHIALPARRTLDDQARRARQLGALVQSPEAFERRLRALLDATPRPADVVLDHGAFARELIDYVASRTR
ncbi:MAG: hypothetical protein R3B89_19805 [Polyangiaceae bacterium]